MAPSYGTSRHGKHWNGCLLQCWLVLQDESLVIPNLHSEFKAWENGGHLWLACQFLVTWDACFPLRPSLCWSHRCFLVSLHCHPAFQLCWHPSHDSWCSCCLRSYPDFYSCHYTDEVSIRPSYSGNHITWSFLIGFKWFILLTYKYLYIFIIFWYKLR